MFRLRATITCLGSLVASAFVPGCAADTTTADAVGTESSAIICSVNTPPGTKCTIGGGGGTLPLVEYETVNVSDVSATVSFTSPRGPVATSVTVNFAAVAPKSPTDGLASASDAPSTGHTLSLNGLVAGTKYRYDIWVGANIAYTTTFTTAAPVPVVVAGAGAHDPVISPLAYQAAIAINAANPYNTVGFVVGVRRGAVEDIYAFGSTDEIFGSTVYNGTSLPITGGPPTATTVFPMASISKTFTATLLARYATDPTLAGANVHLDDNIVSYLPAAYQVGGWQNSVTPRELANYTSGLPRNPGPGVGSVQGVFANFDATPEGTPPGTVGAYSNFGFILLGRALECKIGGVAGGAFPSPQTWESLIAQKIAAPLGLGDTQVLLGEAPASYMLSAQQMSRMAQGYGCGGAPCSATSRPVPNTLPPASGTSPFNPAGGLMTTANDMMKWLSANMGHTSAGWMAPTLAQTRTGLGWGRTTLASTATGQTATMLEKDGDAVGAGQSYIAYLPELDVGVFVLSNNEQFDSPGVVLSVLAALPPSALVNLPAY